MDKNFVTETPDELLDNAEQDLLSVDTLFNKTYYPEDRMYKIICFHAAQAIEKFLKAYIITQGHNIEKTHMLDFLYNKANKIDNTFEKIEDDCLNINKLIPNIKYSKEKPISKQNLLDVIRSVNNICKFLPIKSLRESFHQKYNYQVVTEIITEKMSRN
jgi:HEPN domain-containing protein